VTDEEILDAHASLGRREGMFVCPEGAATLAALRRLVKDGWIEKNERVVLLNTGTGLKYPESVDAELPLLQPGDSLTL
jgi:threonine synthase